MIRHSFRSLACTALRAGRLLSILGLLLSPVLVTPTARAQADPPEPALLPQAISTADLTMRGRYARQWRNEAGELVVVFNGAFQLDFGLRQLSADEAVVWLRPGDDAGTRYYEVTVYLSGRAYVLETAGTIVEDRRLLVRNLRTSGQVVKLHDVHSRDPADGSSLYQEAERARAGLPAGEGFGPVVVQRPPGAARRDRARLLTYEFGNVEPITTENDEIVQVVTDGVYFSQTGGPGTPALEIRASSAVVFTAPDTGGSLLAEFGDAPPGGTAPQDAPSRGGEPRASEGALGELSSVQEAVRAVYLEGDVVITLDTRFVRASRMYYDFEQDRALILDGVVRADLPDRNVPMYVRAAEIRQLSAREFAASNARISTSEFYTPHYHVGVEQVYLEDRSQLDAAGRPSGAVAGSYELQNATLNVGGLPLLWWPYSQGDYSTSETLIRSIRIGNDDEFGTQFQSRWALFNLLGVGPPDGYDADLRLDYLSERGPAIGIDMDYQRPTHFGFWRGYYVNDDGDDRLGPLRDDTPETNNRGRLLWRHRHYLPQDWEATLELSYVSDPHFLEIYEESEWFEQKDQETVLFLKRAQEKDAITLLANWRLLDFVTQTEHLPDITYRRFGDTFADPLVMYHESRIGFVRYRPDDRRAFDSRIFNNDGRTDTTFRADVRQEAELPLKLDGFNVVPYASFRGTGYSDETVVDGTSWRGFGLYGVRGSGTYARIYDDVQSDLFDINRLRHIVQPYFNTWWSHSNARSTQLTPFDEGVETIEDFYGGLIGVYQAWQTKRGPDGDQRTVDLMTLRLEAGFFGDAQDGEYSNGYVNFMRPEDSRSRNYVGGEFTYRLGDTTTLLYDFNYDLNDSKPDRHNVSIAVERLPRVAYVAGWRYASDIDMNLLGGGANYRLNEKHTTAIRAWYDVDRGGVGEITLGYIRRLPRWNVGVTMEVDRIQDDISLSLSMWPEGIPEWTIGSRAFTGLADTVGIRP